MIETLLSSAIRQGPTLENSVHYIAHTFSFLVTGEDTDNAYALIHCYFRKGFTPPQHFHKYEDESFYILDGVIDFQAGEKKFIAGAGELVVLPREIPHSFNLITGTAKALLLITPAGFEKVFKEFGRPAQTLDLPSIPDNLPKELFQQIHQRCIDLGNVWMPEV
ncbi:MAG TPA: cupin domain-containing protein [Chitinophagaceae bacterium]|nr:cupin domain-containing protein [Chitinophagaceae bacterium]